MEAKQLRLGAKDEDIIKWLENKSFSSYVKELIRNDMAKKYITDEGFKELKEQIDDIKSLILNINACDITKSEVAATTEKPKKKKSGKMSMMV